MSYLKILKPSTTSSVLVADTGPLLALARINQCPLLGKLFRECRVTASVVDECLAKPEHTDAQRIQQALGNGLLKAVPDPRIRQALQVLDAGEQTAIELALSDNLVLLIDEKRGRAIAKAQGATIVGTIGILLLAKKAGLIREIKSLLTVLGHQYYFSKTLIQYALDIANE